jgi:cytochrome P450
MRACEQRYGGRFTVQLAGEGPCVYLAAPDDVGRAFTAPGALAGAVNRQLAPVLGERSVLLLDGPEHLAQRRLQLPAFQGASLEHARAVIEQTTARALDGWPVGGVVALRPRMQAITLEAILRVALGVEDGPRLAGLQEAVTVWLRAPPRRWRSCPRCAATSAA